MKVTRPVCRWHGGKWKLAPWIISHFPHHRVYVEPFGGAASVLLQKDRSYAEVYNDLDGDIVNLFRVFRCNDSSAELLRRLELTPFARREFELAYGESYDNIERARHLLILGFMGFGSNGHNKEIKTGFRSNSNRSGTTPAHDWRNYPGCMPAIIERLRGVVIENRDALKVMQQHDGLDTLHYVDPPYVWETRSSAMHRNRCYKHELDSSGHKQLLKVLKNLKGFVCLSAYPHPSYDKALKGWDKIEISTHADGALDRTEVLWLNPRAAEENKNLLAVLR